MRLPVFNLQTMHVPLPKGDQTLRWGLYTLQQVQPSQSLALI